MWFWVVEVEMPNGTVGYIASQYCFARCKDARKHFDDERENLELYMESQEVIEALDVSFVWVPCDEKWKPYRWN